MAVEWEDGDKYDHYTTRSLNVSNIRKRIHAITQYQRNRRNAASQRIGIQYKIENNPLIEKDHHYEQRILNDIQQFYMINDEGNDKPLIKALNKRNELKKQSNVIGIQRLTESQCLWQKALIDQLDCFAKCDIDKGVILGQYIGWEMLEDEYRRLYGGTREDEIHRIYLHGESVLIPMNIHHPSKKRKLNENVLSNNNKWKEGEQVFIVIDAWSKDKNNPLLYINDGRANIERPKPTRKDNESRINVDFISVLVNGWINIVIRTKRKIKKNESILGYYGEYYKDVMERAELEFGPEKRLLQQLGFNS